MGRMKHPKEPIRTKEVENIGRIRTGFKVCRCIGYYNIVSAFPNLGRGKDYHIGSWTHRPFECGPLALFDRLIDAENFLKREDGEPRLTIFLCEYEESEEKVLYTKSRINRSCLPNGTVFGNKVKLIKRMYKD